MLMTPVTPSQVYLLVSTESTLTHIPLTELPISITLLVIRVLHLMTQVCSTAHTFLFRWFVQLERTPSSLRSDSRLVTVLLLTHSLVLQVELIPANSRLTTTVTTEESPSRTSCDPRFTYFTETPSGVSFFYLNTNKNDVVFCKPDKQ